MIFPVVLNTVLGVRSIPITMHRAALSLGASRARMLWEVVLPGALPNIITGLRNGLGYGWRALIATEIIVGTSGIGFHVRRAPRRFGRRDPARHDHPRHSLVHRRRLDSGADRAGYRTALGIGDAMKNLIIRNLSKTYFDRLCRHVTSPPCTMYRWTCSRGEFVSIVGPSGCGKIHHPQHDRRLYSAHGRRDTARRQAREGSRA